MTTADPDFDVERMRIAIEHARMSRPSPNPPVGALVVDVKGERVATAHHQAAGEEHAEVAALRAAGDAAKGGALYVTLEPCNHEGKTAPCVDAILASGIKRVVIGCTDPNPHVRGGGAERMREAGLDVVVGVCGSEARQLIAPWAKYIT
ncbi:MAG TPA: bifunctional diaminohydroxyphosphoribosylaminopyrimidine deaminase/5-amino-6-(5-phosphoribosylamino)uracil reductase RibD, partial [Sorangium sp.]|nr:bifunctional diaminohydroxyphosphoribosylaminopyrimidine deaminase/5-amino-6-(5-phosphoribosylamino)uracil reductase RibD [Sorangium sp.]